VAYEAALPQALDWAATRRQGRAPDGGPILGHPDMRRMIARLKADLLAARAIALRCAQAQDDSILDVAAADLLGPGS
jgi:alkylation response protein AidB-like acyl-CoA dehydrogenase